MMVVLEIGGSNDEARSPAVHAKRGARDVARALGHEKTRGRGQLLDALAGDVGVVRQPKADPASAASTTSLTCSLNV